MADEDPLVTRLYNIIPSYVQRLIRKGMTRSRLLLLLKFYFGEGNVLREKGWFESERRGYPVSKTGDPLPWYTYSAISFLEERVNDRLDVFEYGGGYSTVWWGDRVDRVTAVEDDGNWVEEIRPRLPDGCQIEEQDVDDGYVEAVKECEPLDVVVIDGKRRPECIEPAADSLSASGVIVADDYHRERIREEFESLRERGFDVVPFYGLKALNSHYRCTAIFYREENCLGL